MPINWQDAGTEEKISKLLENEAVRSQIGAAHSTVRDLIRSNLFTKAFNKSISGLNRRAARDGRVAQGYAPVALPPHVPSLLALCCAQLRPAARACPSRLSRSRSCRGRAASASASAAAPGQERAAVRLAQCRRHSCNKLQYASAASAAHFAKAGRLSHRPCCRRVSDLAVRWLHHILRSSPMSTPPGPPPPPPAAAAAALKAV